MAIRQSPSLLSALLAKTFQIIPVLKKPASGFEPNAPQGPDVDRLPNTSIDVRRYTVDTAALWSTCATIVSE